MGIILASASPRRRELLEMLGISGFEVLPADVDEVVPETSPVDAVIFLARQKARKVAVACPADALIIAADTLVYLDGKPLGKPETESDAKNMLQRLSGVKHSVVTGVALIKAEKETAFAERTEVFFRQLSDQEIDAYIKTGEPMDKAGAYGAQGKAAMFISRIEGDFFNVMGLPICRLITELRLFEPDFPV